MKLVKKDVDVSGVDIDDISKQSNILYDDWTEILNTKIGEAMAHVGVTSPEEEAKKDKPRISVHSTNELGGTTTVKFCGTPIFEYHISTNVDLANPVMTLKYKTIVDEQE